MAVGACCRHFALAAGLNAFTTILFLTPTITIMQVDDRVIPTGGVQTLLWMTSIVGLAIATEAALAGARTQILGHAGLRPDRLPTAENLDRLMVAQGA